VTARTASSKAVFIASSPSALKNPMPALSESRDLDGTVAMMSDVKPLAWPSSATRTIIPVTDVALLTRGLALNWNSGRSTALGSNREGVAAAACLREAGGAIGTLTSMGPTGRPRATCAARPIGVTVRDLTVSTAPACVPIPTVPERSA
jgi:hypothetical protein